MFDDELQLQHFLSAMDRFSSCKCSAKKYPITNGGCIEMKFLPVKEGNMAMLMRLPARRLLLMCDKEVIEV